MRRKYGGSSKFYLGSSELGKFRESQQPATDLYAPPAVGLGALKELSFFKICLGLISKRRFERSQRGKVYRGNGIVL